MWHSCFTAANVGLPVPNKTASSSRERAKIKLLGIIHIAWLCYAHRTRKGKFLGKSTGELSECEDWGNWLSILSDYIEDKNFKIGAKL